MILVGVLVNSGCEGWGEGGGGRGEFGGGGLTEEDEIR